MTTEPLFDEDSTIEEVDAVVDAAILAAHLVPDEMEVAWMSGLFCPLPRCAREEH